MSEFCSSTGRVRTDERFVKGLYGPSVKVRTTDAAVLLERNEDRWGQEVRSQVGQLPQHLKEVHDGEEKRRKEVARGDAMKTVMGVLENGVVSRTLTLHLQNYLTARTRLVQEKRVLK